MIWTYLTLLKNTFTGIFDMTNEDWKQIEPKLHAAVGQKLNVMSMNVMRSDHVDWWLSQGYDVDMDIIPAIKNFMITFKQDHVVSWRLFDPAIKHHHRQRMFRKSRTSSFANSKNFNSDDAPTVPRDKRKKQVEQWFNEIRPKMEIE